MKFKETLDFFILEPLLNHSKIWAVHYYKMGVAVLDGGLLDGPKLQGKVTNLSELTMTIL